MDYAKHVGVDIVNLSNGGLKREGPELASKIDELIRMGIVVVAAAGNEGPQYGTINSPADLPDVVAVGSTNLLGSQVSTFSSRGFVVLNKSEGAFLPKPDVLTFGEHIVSSLSE